MYRKSLYLLLCLLVCLCAPALAEEPESLVCGEYKYSLNSDGTATIGRYYGKSAAVTVPDELDGHAVTGIRDMAFAFLDTLESVALPCSVTSLSNNPFYACDQLQQFIVPADHPTLEVVDGVLFDRTSDTLICYPIGLAQEAYSVPQGTYAIGDRAFACCSALQSVTLPDTLRSIGEQAFFFCDALWSISLPEGFYKLGDCAFQSCAALKSVHLPDSLIAPSGNPFLGCDQLVGFSVSPDHPVLAQIDGVLFHKPSKMLICYPPALPSDTYSVPEGIKHIGCDAFYHCDHLKAIILPETLVSLGHQAFYDCSSLQSINLPDSLIHVGANPFSDCRYLKNIDLSPDHPALALVDGLLLHKPSKTVISYLDAIASSACQVPDGITAIGPYAFSDSTGLTSLSLPESLTTIGDFAFAYFRGLTSLSLPESVTSIGENAFLFADDLTLTVARNSYAAEYAKQAELQYTYPDSLDWLKE